MKHYICIFISISLLWISCKEETPKETIFNGNIELNNYFDQSTLEGIKTINGDLTISYLGNEDLSVLSDLEEITGTLEIFNNPNLRDISGLKNLSEIGGDLILHSCAKLESINAFGQTYCDGNIEFSYLENIPIEAMEQALSLKNLKMHGLKAQTVDFLPNLQKIDGLLDFSGNQQLETFSFPALEEVDELYFLVNKSLVNLEGFSALKKINQSFELVSNQSISNLEGLEALENLPFDFKISGNDNLTSLDGVENAQGPSFWNIHFNKKLDNFCVLKSIYQNSSQILVTLMASNNKSNPTYQEVLDNCP